MNDNGVAIEGAASKGVASGSVATEMRRRLKAESPSTKGAVWTIENRMGRKRGRGHKVVVRPASEVVLSTNDVTSERGYVECRALSPANDAASTNKI